MSFVQKKENTQYVTVSPERKSEFKLSLNFLVLGDGVYDLANSVQNPSATLKWEELTKKLDYVGFVNNSSSSVRKVKHFLCQGRVKREKIVVGVATANTPYFNSWQESRLKYLVFLIIEELHSEEKIDLLVSIGRNALSLEEIIKKDYPSVEFVSGPNFLNNIDVLISTKSTLIVEAEKNGVFTVELLNKVMGSTLSEVKIFDEESAMVVTRALKAISNYEYEQTLFSSFLRQVNDQEKAL
ncbi:hypothetical protein [Halomonas sp. S2151]|uniref:hypothetical protein n=1 Tax=Halomonas sp. S2151 TaxID=579478 RepID=UPI00138E01FA|nr:hypothetical protein [Halomonas sp. S2151]